MKTLLLALALCVAPIIETGCATSTAQHPGAINALDSQAYDALVTIQAGIESAKTQFAGNPAAKDPLNKVIAGYNTAMAAYKVFHTTANPTAAAQTDLQNQIAAVKASLAALTAQFGKP